MLKAPEASAPWAIGLEGLKGTTKEPMGRV